MSEDRDLDSVVTVSADGISVEKRFERDTFAVPAVEFTIQSDRERPTTVRLVDNVPEEFPMDSVGFHPEYYNDDWTAFKDHRVEFERELSPGEELVTVYGVRLSESDDIADFMGEPELEDLSAETEETPSDPLASITGNPEGPMDGNTITDIVSEDGNQVVRDVLAGKRDSMPGLGDDDAEPADPVIGEPAGAQATETADSEASPSVDAEVDPLADLDTGTGGDDGASEPSDVSDPLAEPIPEPSGSSESSEPTEAAESTVDSEATVEPADVEVDPTPADDADEPSEIVTAEPDLPATGNVASALAKEIREGSVSEGDLTVLRQELDIALPESTNVRIRHLQSRVEDLTAYTEALEGFIDENGTATQVLEEFEAFEGEVADLVDEIDELETEIKDVQGFEDERQTIDSLEERVDALQTERADTDERLDALESRMESISEGVEENSERLQEVRDDLQAVQRLQSDVDSIQSKVDALSGLDERVEIVEGLEDRLAAVEGLDERVAAIEGFEEQFEAIEGIKTDIAAVRAEFGELEELVGANTEDLTAIQSTLSNVEAELAGVTDVEGDVQSIDERLEDLSESFESTEHSLETTVSELQTEVGAITDDVEEIRAWRDQLKGVFGSGDG